MEVIRLLRHRWELRGTLYFEFQPGAFRSLHWQPGSVYIREEFVADLETIIARHHPGHSHYAFTTIPAPTWSGILAEFDTHALALRTADREHARRLLPLLVRWYIPEEGLAWRRAALRYGRMIRDLSEWIREQLLSHDAVSVLGI